MQTRKRLQRKKPMARGAGPKRSKAVKKRNPARRAKEFARCYHSVERVEWIQSLRCVASGLLGNIDNAHISGGGMGRKAHYSLIVPLAAECHRELHRIGRPAFEAKWRVSLAVEAERVHKAWHEYATGTPWHHTPADTAAPSQ